MTGPSVLLVEDDRNIREQMICALELEGYDVQTAENGHQALQTLLAFGEDQRPACMILDLMMPQMDGLELLEVLKNQHRGVLQSINVIVTTARSLQASELPENVDWLKKPFDLNELYQVVKKCCRPSQSH